MLLCVRWRLLQVMPRVLADFSALPYRVKAESQLYGLGEYVGPSPFAFFDLRLLTACIVTFLQLRLPLASRRRTR
jgi:hypothetical protein